MQKNENGPLSCLTPCKKMNSAWVQHLNVRPDNMKFLEENIGGKLLDTRLGDYFLSLTPKPKATKAKTNKWDGIKLKSSCIAKATTRKRNGNLLNERT